MNHLEENKKDWYKLYKKTIKLIKNLHSTIRKSIITLK
jgi:hypothetical protein